MDYTQPFFVGDWLVTPALNQVTKSGQVQTLVPKVMSLLVLLAQQDNQPVSQEFILATIWQNKVVSDSSVYQGIAQLRKVFNDTKSDKEVILRVSGKGYRLILPVKQDASASKKYSRKKVFTAIVILIALMFIFFFSKDKPQETISPQSTVEITAIKSIAIYPLEYEEQELSKPVVAIEDVLLTQLMNVSDLKIINWGHNNDVPLTQAHLKGRISLQGDNIRVYLQIEHLANKQVIWAQVFDGKLDKLFTLQDNITKALLTLLNKKQISKALPESVVSQSVFEQYLLARYLWSSSTPENLIKAQTILEDLSHSKQLFPLAAVGLCETYHSLYVYSDWPLAKVLNKCEPLLIDALAVKPDLGQAIAAQAFLKTSQRQFDEAEALFEQAIELAPNYPITFLWYGNMLRDIGQYKKALSMSLKAYELSPMSDIINRSLAYSYLNLRQSELARKYYQRSLTIAPNARHHEVRDLDFFALSQERATAFIVWAENNEKELQRQPNYRLTQILILLSLGDTNSARNHFDGLQAVTVNPSFRHYVEGTLLVAEGQNKQAQQIFKQRFEMHQQDTRFLMPYLMQLSFDGHHQQVIDLLRTHFPILFDELTKVTIDTVFPLTLLATARSALLAPNKYASLTKKMNNYYAGREDVYAAEWALMQGDIERARTILNRVLNQGWLPDFNDDHLMAQRVTILRNQLQMNTKSIQN